jgi:D-alanyl-lipoteichoic acid acyltransferase DltB (MBOAT superfamily)
LLSSADFGGILRRYPSRNKSIVVVCVIANIVLLKNFNAMTGSDFDYLKLMLPLGISNFTFQQISCLIDIGALIITALLSGRT